jgi:twitching motility protein PilT
LENTPKPQPANALGKYSDQPADQACLALEKYFHAMIKAGASDLHLKSNSVPHIRTKAVLHPTQVGPLSAGDIAQMAYELMTDKQARLFEETGNVDVAYELANSDRFRVNVYRQRGNIAIAVRRVAREIPTFEELHLPPIVRKIAEQQHGLVLISGASGSGKSTTIAAMLEHMNKTRPCHILTIEDPIEYLFEDKKAFVSQREVGIDVDSYERALKYLMRADPDLVLIGEMRDHETFTAALQASETGHLVLGTVHASTAPQTVGRVLDLVGAESRALFRQSLSFNLQAVVCQMLLPSVADNLDRVPAVEVLINSPTVRQLIQEGRESELGDLIRVSQPDGMQSFTQSLMELIEKDYIDPQIAYEVAPNPDELRMVVRGITSEQPGLISREGPSPSR